MGKEFGSGRASGEITLYFEKIPVELKLFKARSEEKVELNQFSEAGNPIGYSKIDKITGEKVEKIVKGKKIGDSVVLFTDDEINLLKMKKNREIKELSIEDLENPKIEEVKEIYFAKPTNNILFSLIASGLKDKQVKFKLVDGNQEREAILQYINEVVKVYLKYFKEECVDEKSAKVVVNEIDKEKQILIETLFANMNKPIKAEGNRQKILEEMIAKKMSGEKIEVEAVAKVKEETNIDKMLQESLLVAVAKKKKKEVV